MEIPAGKRHLHTIKATRAKTRKIMVLPLLLGHVSSKHCTHYQPINNKDQNILKNVKLYETKK